MPTPVASFGPEHTRRDAPEAAAVAEEVIVSMIEHAKRFDVDPADVASLVMFDAAARLCAYGRTTLPVILATLGSAVPACELLLRRQRTRRGAAAIERRQAPGHRPRRLPIALNLMQDAIAFPVDERQDRNAD
jgi:hypothetical protein